MTTTNTAPAAPRGERTPFAVEFFGDRDVIYKAGQTLRKAYLLRAGRVRLLHTFSDGRQATVAILGASDLFGAVLQPGAAEETAVVAGDAEVWSVETAAFAVLLEERPRLAVDILRMTHDRVRALRRRVLGASFQEAPAQLAATILSLAEAHGQPCKHGGQYDLNGITQQDLADLIGKTRTYASSNINEMKRAKVLQNVGRTLCVLDVGKLRKIAAGGL